MDPLLLDYVWILGGCLLLAAVGIYSAGRLGRDVARVWPTYRSWLVIIPLAVVVIGLGRVSVVIGVAALSLTGIYEFARAAGLDRHRWMVWGTAALAVATYAKVLLPGGDGSPGWWAGFVAMPMVAVVVLFAIPVLRNKSSGALEATSLSLVGYLLVGWMLAHVAWIANLPQATGTLLFLLFAVEVTDIAAFSFGSLLGRHKLCPEISPNKTWEGALGALAVAMLLPWLMRFSLPAEVSTATLLLAGAAIGIGGQLGDLSVSLIKRNLGVKDMGTLIPGHGGVLDRIDSLLLAGPLFFYCIAGAV